MLIILGVFLVFIGLIMIWFNMGYSPLKSSFKRKVKEKIALVEQLDSCYSESDFETLPLAIRNFIKNSDFIGKPQKRIMKINYKNVDFCLDEKKPKLKIDYTQYNFSHDLVRLAFIDTSMFGIPFQGFDYLLGEKAGMRGVLGKCITLFHTTGEALVQGSLVTYLSECLFLPTALINGTITFSEIDALHVKAMTSIAGISVAGIFTFNEDYEMISFTTEKRGMVNGSRIEYFPWQTTCDDYEFNSNGLKLPTHLRATWSFSDHDFVYFAGQISELIYL